MNPHITVVTLGVRNIRASLAFYRDGLGLPTREQSHEGDADPSVVFFKLDGGLVLSLFPRADLMVDAALPVEQADAPVQPTFSLAHNVDSKEAVDEVMAQAEAAGATITDRPHDREWGGYSGYFRDPDGFLWEVAWNPTGFDG